MIGKQNHPFVFMYEFPEHPLDLLGKLRMNGDTQTFSKQKKRSRKEEEGHFSNMEGMYKKLDAEESVSFANVTFVLTFALLYISLFVHSRHKKTSWKTTKPITYHFKSMATALLNLHHFAIMVLEDQGQSMHKPDIISVSSDTL